MQGEESLRILVEPEGDSFPLMEISTCETEASEQWDYVLVAQRHTQRDPRQARQQQFLEELRRKGFHIKVIRDQKQVFFGIRADNSVFGLYRTLLLEPEGPAPHAELAAPTTIPVTTSLRIRIVNFVVMNNKTSAGETFEDLMKDGVFEARFPLHKGEGRLKKTWARWRHMFREQPVDEIRNYFGEKVALYFVWLGWYTYMLVPAALTGLLVFLSGFSLFEASQISKEICEAHDILMCPLGDHSRRYQRLSETCTFAKLTHLFDNDGTVVFAIFMALWATVFLEIWKRQRARVVLHWDLYVWDEEQEEMALQLINCPDYKLRPYQHSYLRSTVILVLTLLMICLMIGMAHVLVVYRVLASALFSSSAVPFLEEQVTTAVVVTGALVHYVTIIIMTKINRCVALKLCDFEMPRTFSERESRFTIRFFTLQFFTHFSSLIYIAFILGRDLPWEPFPPARPVSPRRLLLPRVPSLHAAFSSRASRRSTPPFPPARPVSPRRLFLPRVPSLHAAFSSRASRLSTPPFPPARPVSPRRLFLPRVPSLHAAFSSRASRLPAAFSSRASRLRAAFSSRASRVHVSSL
eukprot:XP_011518350.1 anoctamin-9 isoform X5 [Homo sapiens]